MVAGNSPFDEDIVRLVFGESYGSADSIIVMDARCLVSSMEAVGLPAISTFHLGTHPGWYASVLSSANWSAFVHNVFVRLWAVVQEARRRGCTLEALIIVCCKSGVHRSKAAGFLTALAIQLNTDFDRVVELMAVPMTTVGSSEDYVECEHNGDRPCEVCRVQNWKSEGVRRQVWPVVQAEAPKAKRIAFPHG